MLQYFYIFFKIIKNGRTIYLVQLQIRFYRFMDLVSLLSKHFWTPLTTPAASQENREDEREDDDTGNHEINCPQPRHRYPC